MKCVDLVQVTREASGKLVFIHSLTPSLCGSLRISLKNSAKHHIKHRIEQVFKNIMKNFPLAHLQSILHAPLGNHSSVFCMLGVWTFYKNGVMLIHYVVFVTGFFHSASSFQVHPVLQYVSLVHSLVQMDTILFFHSPAHRYLGHSCCLTVNVYCYYEHSLLCVALFSFLSDRLGHMVISP